MARKFTKYPSNYVKADADLDNQSTINILTKIKSEIESVIQEPAYQHEDEDWQVGLEIAVGIIDKYINS